MTPGIYYDIPFEDYLKIEALNNGTLVSFLKTPAHSQVIKEPTPAMQFGTDFHTFLLEPNRYKRDYIEIPEGMKKTGKKWDEFQADNPSKYYISHNDNQTILRMMESLNSGYHEIAWNLIKRATHREVTIIWDNVKFGVRCKGRIDLLTDPSLGILGDIKTTQNADPEQWIKTGINAGHPPHLQPSHYLTGINTVLREEVYQEFIWLLFETKPPYGISVMKAPEDMLYLAEEQIKRIIPKYIECKRHNIYQDYLDKIVDAKIPKWYYQLIDI
ncbi:hypothetical protein LCGC14_1935190 [marine sediment metagenome]|uniref:Putative exodeoxyribonuclease 8 PDDEXK-like domain-containing protein n=1 Tax=marine sediment metagenome TaxID=412755 RepID=A0A0F9FLX8_9ZZZZ